MCGHGGYPRKWGPGGPQQVRIKGLLKKEGDSAQLAKLRMGFPPPRKGGSAFQDVGGLGHELPIAGLDLLDDDGAGFGGGRGLREWGGH